MSSDKILIVDDEKLVRWSLRHKYEEWGYQVLEAEDGASALKLAREASPDLSLLDIRLPDMNGLAVLERMKQAGDGRAVIMITAVPQIEDVKAALKMGAYDFVTKPLDFDQLLNTTRNALEATRLRNEVQSLRGEVLRQTGYHEVIGVSQSVQTLMRFVHKVAASKAGMILIQGESGTGKDLIAKTIHYQGPRQNSPFIAINCAAIPETLVEAELFGHERGAFTDAKVSKKGLFELANGGTLLLDEIGELSHFLQAKLLRVLEDQIVRRVGGVRDFQVDVRFIAASNQDLERAVREGRFREDLYYRLSVISIFIPPLRERKEDILPLVDFFIDFYNHKFRKTVRGVAEDTRRLLLNYDWPGNVRELRNAIERSMILEDAMILRRDYLPFSVTQPQAGITAFERAASPPHRDPWEHNERGLPPLFIPEGGTSLEGVEKCLVSIALQQAGGNQTQAARLLDISRDALRYKMKKYGLEGGRGELATGTPPD